MILDCFMAFALLFTLDFVWGAYIKTVADRKALFAAAWSVPVYLIGAAMTIAVVHEPMLMFPAALGAFAGTYLSVRFK